MLFRNYSILLAAIALLPAASLAATVNLTLTQKITQARTPVGGDLTIAANEIVTIDRSADLGGITINGKLQCRTGDASVNDKFSIQADRIMVMGAGSVFECGNGPSAANRFMGQFLRIWMKKAPGKYNDMMGDLSLSAMSGGTIRMYGRPMPRTWTKLDSTILPGARQLKLTQSVKNLWKPGDKIAIASTSYNFREAEEVTIETIADDGVTINIVEPLGFKYKHSGGAWQYSNGKPVLESDYRLWVLNQKAEVANLTRNILITSDDPTGFSNIPDRELIDSENPTSLGAQMMIMKGSFAYIDAVEFNRVGQLGKMGKYPFHWHLVGDASGQFIRNSSVHNSFQRCITVHGTNNATVQNNVCYDHFGHGYFLENGNETGNQIIDNIGMRTRRPGADFENGALKKSQALLVSDVFTSDRTRHGAPATFWITNPKNTIKGNVAAGSSGSGFWMAFPLALDCINQKAADGITPLPGICGVVPADQAQVFPVKELTTEFSNNTAHTNGVGITWNAGESGPLVNQPNREPILPNNMHARIGYMTHYSPVGQKPVYTNLTAYKNIYSGVYFRGNEAIFENLIASDNQYSLFLTNHQIVKNSLIVGTSQGFDVNELNDVSDIIGGMIDALTAVRMYDGPFELDNVHMANFKNEGINYIYNKRDATTGALIPTPKTIYAFPINNLGGAARFFNFVRKLTFNPEPRYRVALDRGDYRLLLNTDTINNSFVKDMDGSLDGVAGRTLVINYPLNFDNSCVPTTRKTGENYASPVNGTTSFGLSCAYKPGIINFGTSRLAAEDAAEDSNLIKFSVTREEFINGERVNRIQQTLSEIQQQNKPGVNHNKTGLILDKNYLYTIDFDPVNSNGARIFRDSTAPYASTATIPAAIRFNFQNLAEFNGTTFIPQLSPAIEIKSGKRKCVPFATSIIGKPQIGLLQNNEQDVWRSDVPAFYSDINGKFVGKFQTTKEDGNGASGLVTVQLVCEGDPAL